MREKALALRKINGTSVKGSLWMLATKLVITLCWAMATLLKEWLLPSFKTLVGIRMNTGLFYLNILKYALFMIGVLTLFSLAPIHYFRRQMLQNLFRDGSGSGKSRNLFCKVSLTLQLAICIGFIFVLSSCSNRFIICTIRTWVSNATGSILSQL